MDKMAKSSDTLLADLSLFFRLATEKQVTQAEELVQSSIRLIENCPAARRAVLCLFGLIIEEYCVHYVHTSAGSDAVPPLGPYLSLLSHDSSICSQTGNADVRRISSDRRQSSSSNQEMDETPASPPPLSGDPALDTDLQDRFQSAHQFFESLSSSLLTVMESPNKNLVNLIANWALDSLCQLASRLQPLKEQIFSLRVMNSVADADQTGNDIKDQIDYWQKCSVIDVLMRLVLKSIGREEHDLKNVLFRLMNFKPESGSPPETEWICCAFITSAPGMNEISSCIDFLLNSPVADSLKESIFAFLSTQNPESVITCSKGNIPFLLRLCTKSPVLLRVLSEQVSRLHIDIHRLNHMENLPIDENSDLRRDLITCLLSADKSFDLLTILCQVCMHEEANHGIKSQTMQLLEALANTVYEGAYSGSVSSVRIFMQQLNQNYEKVICSLNSVPSPRLKQFHLKLIKALAFDSDFEFAVVLLHEVMDKTPGVKEFDCYDSSAARHDDALAALFRNMKLTFGRQMKVIFNKLLLVDKWKTDVFWLNFLSLVHSEPDIFDLSPEAVTNHLTDLLHMDLFRLHVAGDHRIDALIIVLKLIPVSMVRKAVPPQLQGHILSDPLVLCYINLVQRLEGMSADQSLSDEQLEKMTVALISVQTAMRKLVTTGGKVGHQEMLTRAFMECILSWNEERHLHKRMNDGPAVSPRLKDENMTYNSSAFKFRKVALNQGKDVSTWRAERENQPLLSRPFARQLLLDGLKACIQDMERFSDLLVECVSPDVMFNDMTWPDEDFFKVTIEHDLLISKQYDRHPILWDLTELLAEEGHLRHCSVLIRALLAVQLTGWSAGTSSELPDADSLQATQRLLQLLATSKLIPDKPFKFLPQVLCHFTSWEICCVSNDLWKWMRDSSVNQKDIDIKPYVERLRVIMADKCPGETYVQMFRGL